MPHDGPAALRTLPGAAPAVARLAGLGTLTGLVSVAQALTLAWAVACLVRGASWGVPFGLLAALLVARGLLAAAGEVLARRASLRVVAEARSRLLHGWLATGPTSRPRPTEALTLAGPGLDSLEPYVARYLPALVTAVVVPTAAVLVLLWVDPWSALIVMLTVPLLPLFAALIGMHTAADSRRRLETLHTLSGHFLDVVRGLPTLVSYGRATRQLSTIAAVGDRHRRATVRTLRTAFLSSAALELLATVSVAMVAVAVGLRLAYGAMDLQAALTAILLAPEAYWPIRRVGQEFHNAADGAQALSRVRSELLTDDAAPPTPPTSGPVTLEGVTFGYPDRGDVIIGLTLGTPAGAGLTTMTGASGSGKSTVLDLIAGVQRPRCGSVQAGPAHLARQRPVLLAGTVLDALHLGAAHASPAQCQEALDAVGLWEALQAREGLATRIGDDGFGLSAGQRTRLALARALLSSPGLVLLDEPTAHVDADADSLRRVIVRMARDRRVIVATHDDELVALADSRWSLTPDGGRAPAPTVWSSATPEPEEGDEPEQDDPEQDEPGPASAEPLSWWQRRTVATRIRLACLLGGLSVASGVALTATSGWLIVQASTQPVVLTLLVAIVGVRAFGLARPVLRYAERVVSHDATLQTLTERRVEVYRRLVPLAPARLGRRRRADLLTSVVGDLDDVVDEQVRARVPWWSTVLASLVAAAILALVLPEAAGVVAAATVLAAWVSRWVARAEGAAQADAVRARGRLRRVTTDVVDRMDDVRAAVGGDPSSVTVVLERLSGAHLASQRAETALIRLRATGLMLLWALLAVTVISTASVAAWGLSTGAISAPVAALVALTPVALSEAWVGLAEVAGARARARTADRRLESVLSQEPAVHDEGTLDLPEGALPVLAADVQARWHAGAPVLGPFTLPLLEPGSRLRLTGGNGVGKSTLVAVLARHLDAAAGTHQLHGVPATQVRLSEARAEVAVVDDEPHAFAGTVRANVRLAAPRATDEEVRSALDAADLSRWLSRQPEGLDTVVTGLSGGERARLAIARAVVSRRRLVLLDEPVAHLDDATAARALHGIVGDPARAIVAISHEPLPFEFAERHLGFDRARSGQRPATRPSSRQPSAPRPTPLPTDRAHLRTLVVKRSWGA